MDRRLRGSILPSQDGFDCPWTIPSIGVPRVPSGDFCAIVHCRRGNSCPLLYALACLHMCAFLLTGCRGTPSGQERLIDTAQDVAYAYDDAPYETRGKNARLSFPEGFAWQPQADAESKPSQASGIFMAVPKTPTTLTCIAAGVRPSPPLGAMCVTLLHTYSAFCALVVDIDVCCSKSKWTLACFRRDLARNQLAPPGLRLVTDFAAFYATLLCSVCPSTSQRMCVVSCDSDCVSVASHFLSELFWSCLVSTFGLA